MRTSAVALGLLTLVVCLWHAADAATVSSSFTITVTTGAPSGGPTIAAALPAVRPGDPFTVVVGSGPGNRRDWAVIAPDGSDPSAIISWAYLNGSTTMVPAVGLASARFRMIAPAAEGAYRLQLRCCDGNTELARGSFSVSAAAPPPTSASAVITAPDRVDIGDGLPKGAPVASFSVTMDDGSPFGGSVRFGAPYFDAGGIFALSGNSIIVNPAGPGVGPNTATITDHITLEAVP